MEQKTLFGLEGKNVFITGAGSGMGLAATKLLVELGANVYATTRSKPLTFPVTKEIKVKDLGCKADLDQLMAELPEVIDAMFICHGMSDPVERNAGKRVQFTNFYSFKYLTEKLIDRVPAEGSVTFITSNGGKGWRANEAKCSEIAHCATWEEADAWYDANKEYADIGYVFSKECQHAYIMDMAFSPEFAKKRRRINGVSPGYTLTAIIEPFSKWISGGDAEAGQKMIEQGLLGAWDGRPAQPEEMAQPMIALGSKLCSYVNGQVLYVDYGDEANWQIAQIRNKTLLG